MMNEEKSMDMEKDGGNTVMDFATSVMEKAKMVEAGELDQEAFVDECITKLRNMSEKKSEQLGGLGLENEGGMPLPDEEL